MSVFKFYGFSDYEDGKIAHLETSGEIEIPVNIFIDNADEIGDIGECSCSIDVFAVGNGVVIYSSADDYYAADTKMDVISMIPVGTFPAKEDDENFEQSPHIFFTGKVTDVDYNENSNNDKPNYCITIETVELTFQLYLRYDSIIEVGNIAQGVVWLYGDMVIH